MDPGDPSRVADAFSLWLFGPDQTGPVTGVYMNSCYMVSSYTNAFDSITTFPGQA
jgi:hypothetical protein